MTLELSPRQKYNEAYWSSGFASSDKNEAIKHAEEIIGGGRKFTKTSPPTDEEYLYMAEHVEVWAEDKHLKAKLAADLAEEADPAEPFNEDD